MIWNEHLELRNRHAIFSPSSPSWLNYTPEEMMERYRTQYRKALGTELHDFASTEIKLHHKISNVKSMRNSIESYIYRKYFNEDYNDCSRYGWKLIESLDVLPKEVYETVKAFINDCIGYKMRSEQPLCYSDNFAGTADAIIFRNNELKIFDLKTGSGAVHMEQLEIYAALFCMEYKIKPADISIELRIYQLDDINGYIPTPEEINDIIDHIVVGNNAVKSILVEED